jgi:hypothetical protein
VPTSSSGFKFYESLLASTYSVEGNFHVDLLPGTWKTSVNRRTVEWAIAKNTTVSVRVQQASSGQTNWHFEFYPNLTLTLLGYQLTQGALRSFDYNENGGISNFDFTVFNEETVGTAGVPAIISHLVPNNARGILAGLLFVSSSSLQKCSTSSGKVCHPFHSMAAQIENDPTTDKPLRFDLRDGSSLTFGNSTNRSDLHGEMMLAQSVSLDVPSLSYDLVENQIHGTILASQIEGSRSNFALNGLVLKAGKTQFDFGALQFSGGLGDDGHINIQDASLDLDLNDSSTIQLTGVGTDGLTLDLSGGAKFRSDTVQMRISDRSDSQFSSTGSLSLSGRVQKGVIGFGRKGYLTLASGNASVLLDRLQLNASGPPTVRGRLQAVVVLGKGSIYLRPDSAVQVVDGTVSPLLLALDSSSNPLVTGQFPRLSLTLADGNQFIVPGGGQIKLVGQGYLSSGADANPMTIARGSDFPFGNYRLDLSFETFRNTPGGAIALRDGHIVIPLLVDESGKMSANAVHGTSVLRIQQSSVSEDLPLALADGTIQQDSVGAPQHWVIPWSGTNINFPQSQTSVIPGHRTDKADERYFPVTIATAIPQPFSAVGVMTIDGSSVQLSGKGQATVVLTIPNGGGQYRDPNNLAAGTYGTDGHDGENTVSQEFWRDDFTQIIGTCEKHLYALPRTYDIPGQLQLDMTNGIFKGRMPNPSVPEIQFGTDGCSFGPGEILSIVSTLPIEIGAPFAAANFLGEWHVITN